MAATHRVLWLLAAAAIASAPGRAQGDPLDAQGRAMLDPIRLLALRPDVLIARLHLSAAARIADIGAGPGFLTLPLARAVPRGRVIATDLRPDYLAALAARAAQAGLTNIERRVVTATRTGLDPGSVDVAILCQVDHYLEDRAAYLAALAPALRQGGRMVLINYARFRDPALAAAKQVGLRVIDAWAPSPPFFMLVLAKSKRP